MTYNSDHCFVRNQHNCSKYMWAKGCYGWKYLDDNRLSIIREEMAKGTTETLHFHSQTQQFFFILKGTASFQFEDEKLELQEGEGIYIPIKTKHQISNQSMQSIEFLVISEPHAHMDRLELTD